MIGSKIKLMELVKQLLWWKYPYKPIEGIVIDDLAIAARKYIVLLINQAHDCNCRVCKELKTLK